MADSCKRSLFVWGILFAFASNNATALTSSTSRYGKTRAPLSSSLWGNTCFLKSSSVLRAAGGPQVEERIERLAETTIIIDQDEQKKVQVQEKQRKPREPWKASYHVSKKTQLKIQQAAEDRGAKTRSGLLRASAVLSTFLAMPPERCNAANLVCALTLSAKAMGTYKSKTNESFRQLLFETLQILHDLVAEERLSSRQLSNAVWAIAKHYDRDPLLLPESANMETSAVSGQQRVETWDLKEVDSSVKELTPAETLDATVDEISRQLTEIVSIEEEAAAQHANGGKTPPRQTKLGELCMVTWAYGILRPRRRPPGWLQPPQMDSLHSLAKKLGAKSRKDFLTFEEWTLNDEDDMSWKQNAKVEIDSSHSNPTDALFDTIAEALCRPSSQNETNFDATASLHDPQLELMRLSDCSWSEIANLAWAFEKCGRSLSPASETLLRALAHEAAWRLRTGGAKTRFMLSRDISQLIWALGTLQQDNFRLAHDLVILLDDFSAYMGFELNDANARDSRPFRSWSSPDIVQTILALSHARVDDSQLLLALFEEAHSRLDSGICASDSRREHGRKTFLAWEVCVLLWAQARLYLTAAEGDVYEQFPGAAVSNIIATSSSTSLNDIGIGPQEKANIAWALTVLEHHQSGEAIDLLRATFYDAAKACKQEGLIQLEHAHQLWQALFLLEEESPSAVSKVPKWFRQLLSDKWNLEKSRKKISSARHKSISQVLNLMGVAHYNEHDEDIDVAIVLKKQASWAHQTYAEESSSAMKVAVEFDGPNHFTRTRIPRGETMAAPVRALGHTVLKYRLLKRKGWTVVRVPFYEFDKIPFWASMERQRYLQRLLKTHANIRFSDVDISDYSAMAPNRKTRFD